MSLLIYNPQYKGFLLSVLFTVLFLTLRIGLAYRRYTENFLNECMHMGTH